MKRAWMIIVIMTVMILMVPTNGRAQESTGKTEQTELEEPKETAGLSLAPARFELVMAPGTEKTVIVNLLYNSPNGEAKPTRLVTNLGDWNISKDGKPQFYPSNSQPNSACSWMIFSPSEINVIPNKSNSIRVTISVPSDAKPGDHTAILFVQQRPDNIKLEENRKQLVVRLRLGAIFYIMVPPIIKKVSLENLKASSDKEGITVIPTLKNEGNSHVRPAHSVKVINSKGAIVAELLNNESSPILSGFETDLSLRIEKALPPDTYSVRYRVDCKDGSGIVEGQTDLVVKENPDQMENFSKN
jgi:hypothetical protein